MQKNRNGLENDIIGNLEIDLNIHFCSSLCAFQLQQQNKSVCLTKRKDEYRSKKTEKLEVVLSCVRFLLQPFQSHEPKSQVDEDRLRI
ncbi:CLUMA_CG003098, isoform A [Clunio marinus]|uniref:CLUMA_CG003098, isoform A n=1 Tax=Clunio marinus TaxID=568069 RepID=A0A1J1HN10_9DIPT|nr:CLUMA_CG003098, isoform A [Clunio marinus]